MKTKFIVSCIAVTTCFAGVLSYQRMVRESGLTDIQMANIEALAQNESSKGKPCYNTITSHEGSLVRYCPTCSYVEGIDTWYSRLSYCNGK